MCPKMVSESSIQPTYHELIASWGIGKENIEYLCNISHRFKICYVEVPQVASLPIKVSLQSADLFPEKPEPRNIHIKHLSPLDSTNKDNFSSVLFGEQYFRFCFVRDPLSRVLSAYLDKIVKNFDSRRDRRLRSLYLDPKKEISFVQFMRRIAELPPHILDIHWRPQHLLLNFSQIGYHHIGRFERFAEDFQVILETIRARSGIETFIQSETVDKADAQLEIKPYLTQEIADIVNEVYSLDYEYLGYRRPQIVGATKKIEEKNLSYRAGVAQTLERYLMFIGHDQSESILIGALLNAHLEMVVANEAGTIKNFSPKTTQYEILRMIFSEDMKVLEYEQKESYAQRKLVHVKGQWERRYSRLRVIGDKLAYVSTMRLYNEPEVLGSFQKTIGVPINVLFVYRNPYDMIATRSLKNLSSNCSIRQDLLSDYKPVDSEKYELDSKEISDFFEYFDKVRKVLAMFSDGQVFPISYEGFVASPVQKLQEFCVFLGVKYKQYYLDGCASMVDANIHKSRYKVKWTREQLDEVAQGIKKCPWLEGYNFYE